MGYLLCPSDLGSEAQIHQLTVNEPLDLRVAVAREKSELLSLMNQLTELNAAIHVVVLPQDAPEWCQRAAEEIVGLSRRAVISSRPEDAPAGLGGLVEPNLFRAVVGTIQWVRSDEILVLIWLGEADSGSSLFLFRQGAIWRSSQSPTEDGEFHPLSEEAYS